MMHNSIKNRLPLKITLVISVLAVIILSALLVRQYQHIRHLDYISAHRQSFFKSLHGSGPLTAADVSSIQIWMTFNYIDRAFVLPPAYLQTNLNIIDSRFPNITIAEYAKDIGLPDAAALMKVQDAASTYFAVKQ